MDQHDRENLMFLLSLRDQQQWQEWAESVSDDDIRYANALLQVGRLEIIDEIVEKFSDLGEAQMVVEYLKQRM